MQTIRDLSRLRSALGVLRRSGSVALVPTMGALHAGHLALIAEARRRAEHVVVSIFVNPTQFAPTDDLDAYPRREAEDAVMLAEAGVAILWAPTAPTMYPAGFACSIVPGGITETLEGAARPGHFAGVATIVAKLFNQVAPDLALFGEKDFQQLAVVRRMVRDLDFPLDIIGVPTVRDADGLALSSRNAYLSTAERATAAALPRALEDAARRIRHGANIATALDDAKASLAAAGFGPTDYVTLVDPDSFEPLAVFDRPARLLAAARLGTTRLIDNIPVVR